jgi:hypothetical protein
MQTIRWASENGMIEPPQFQVHSGEYDVPTSDVNATQTEMSNLEN